MTLLPIIVSSTTCLINLIEASHSGHQLSS